MIASLLSIKIHVHVIDNGNNEIRGGGVKRDVGRDEKQLIKFAWPYVEEWLNHGFNENWDKKIWPMKRFVATHFKSETPIQDIILSQDNSAENAQNSLNTCCL